MDARQRDRSNIGVGWMTEAWLREAMEHPTSPWIEADARERALRYALGQGWQALRAGAAAVLARLRTRTTDRMPVPVKRA